MTAAIQSKSDLMARQLSALAKVYGVSKAITIWPHTSSAGVVIQVSGNSPGKAASFTLIPSLVNLSDPSEGLNEAHTTLRRIGCADAREVLGLILVAIGLLMFHSREAAN